MTGSEAVDATSPVALVVGAACPPGIGRATAHRLAARGVRVVCAERIVEVDGPLPDTACARTADLEAVVESLRARGATAVALALDPGAADAGQYAVDQTVATFGRLDLVAHVSGGLGPALGSGRLLDVSAAAWARGLDVNLTAAFSVATAAARQMVSQGDGGSIVLLSSHAVPGLPRAGVGTFAAAKAAVERLVRDLADELGGHNIRVNAVRPLGVDPDATPGGNPHLSRLVDEGGAAGVNAMGRFQHPDETAAVIDFLLGPDASFVNGAAIDVDGGARW
jgi:NAD(P)-dependent dehydrogenase (short-subunit alcohol dehydrogenase family)